MVYLTRRKIKGNTYLYLEHSIWKDGKSKRAWQVYLGSVRKIEEHGMTFNTQNITTQTLEYGGSVALLKVAEQINLVEIIDRHTDKKRLQGLSVGQYSLISIINRCLAPCSKSKLAKWFKRDYLSRIFTIDHKVLNASTYCHHFQFFTADVINQIEADLMKTLIEQFNLDLNCILYDPTNFFTFIENHEDDQLARYGNSKEKRYNLRIVNVSLLCTMDFGIPLFHRTYEGNTQDVTHFKSVLADIYDRFQFVKREIADITIIFDKGNNSNEALKSIASSNLGFIASLRSSTQKDLLQTAGKEFTYFRLASNEKKVGYYKTRKKIYWVQRTLYVLMDPRKKKKQLLLLLRDLKAKQAEIDTFLADRLNDHKWRKAEVVQKKLKELIGKNPFKNIIEFDISGEYADLKAKITWNKIALAKYVRTLGRSVIFTNRDDWQPEELIQCFRNKYIVEEDFKQLKNPACLSLRPMYHWKDVYIRAHVFSCILGLVLLSIIRKKLESKGLKASIAQIKDAFLDIKATVINHPWKKEEIIKLNHLEGFARQMAKILNLQLH